MEKELLIKALRYCTDETRELCPPCPYFVWDKQKDQYGCVGEMMRDAADALEAAEKRIAELNTKCADLQSQINSMENEIEELLPKEAHWVAVHNGMGVRSNCNRQDRIDNLATHCRYCGSRIKYSCKDLFDDASNLPVDYSRCANIYCVNDKNRSENPNS